MRFLLDTNVLILLEDSATPLSPNLINFIHLATTNNHKLLYHPASEEDIQQDQNERRRESTLLRIRKYTKLPSDEKCPWNTAKTNRNDAADNEILYSLYTDSAHALVTEDRGIHAKAKKRSLEERVYTIQTAEDLLRRLHERKKIQLPHIEEIALHSLTKYLGSDFFNSLKCSYGEERFNSWFINKSREGRNAWVSWNKKGEIGGLCIYAQQNNELITKNKVLYGAALKLSTFKVSEASRGKKIGELFLKAAFRYATENKLENIFIHGNVDDNPFLFELLEDFGFRYVGHHVEENSKDSVYLKEHPLLPPDYNFNEPPFDYFRRYYPHFCSNNHVEKFIVPIKPKYHNILFPDYSNCSNNQMNLFPKNMFHQYNAAGNAIKMAYLCHAQTKCIQPGSIVLFYRSTDEQAITSIGIVESYEVLSDPDKIVEKVKRRTVYSMNEIHSMTETGKEVRVMLFRLVKHFSTPCSIKWLCEHGVLRRAPQSITKIGDDEFEQILSKQE